MDQLFSSTPASDPSIGGVVITGGANGVGFAYAAEFLQRGYSVVICDIQDCSKAAKALESVAVTGAKVFHTKCDVSNVDQVEKLGQLAKDKLGNIQFWINNAGKRKRTTRRGRPCLVDDCDSKNNNSYYDYETLKNHGTAMFFLE